MNKAKEIYISPETQRRMHAFFMKTSAARWIKQQKEAAAAEKREIERRA